ncbi:hypothetical protein E2C04_08020 [Nocardioides daphniae]|uniref:Copper transporter n=1 Tax=Nocardioides daphniae TaxID=402297 RepID=A0A4P7UE06_9ACTN|nr:hypothetical protein E2C04_08020 [Nocardioides daphniae]
MISFRTHVVTLVAVFLALAIGVVLGGGPLSELGRGSEDADALRDDVAQARSEAQFGESFADDVSSTLLGKRLDGREVAVVTLPGADSEVLDGLTERIKAAGGEVTVTQALGSSLVNAGEKSLVDTLGSQLMAQLPDDTVTAGASTYERAGELIGLSLATSGEKSVEATPQSTAVAEGLRAPTSLTRPTTRAAARHSCSSCSATR